MCKKVELFFYGLVDWIVRLTLICHSCLCMQIRGNNCKRDHFAFAASRCVESCCCFFLVFYYAMGPFGRASAVPKTAVAVATLVKWLFW
jgi:hypothetical protein